MPKYKILRNSPHFPEHKEGEVKDLDKDAAHQMTHRVPPLAKDASDEELRGEAMSPSITAPRKEAALKREAEQGAQMPDGPQAQNLTPAEQKEHADKGLLSKDTKQQEADKGKKKQ